MPCLNLLSPSAKKELCLRYLLFLIENILGSLVIFAIIITIALLPAVSSLQYTKEKIAEAQQQAASSFSTYQEKADALRKQIVLYNSLQQQKLLPSSILTAFKQAQGTGIQINNLSWQENGYFQINGLAADRQSLVNFQNILKDQPEIFQEISIPLGQFLPKENLSFSVIGKINL